MSLLLADALLVLSLLFVRPATDRGWGRRLVAHALLLAGCLLVAAASGPGRLLPTAGMVAALGEAGLAWRFGTRLPDTAVTVRRRTVPWLLLALALVALSLRLLPDGTLPPQAAGLLSTALAILLTGLLGSTASAGATGRLTSLLLGGNGMLLVACELPGMAASAPGCLLLLQAGLLCCLLRAWLTPDHAFGTASA